MAHEIYLTAIFIILSVLNIILNFITVLIICCSRRLREINGHILKVSMALADLVMGSLYLVVYSKRVATNGEQGCVQTTPLENIAELLGYFVVGWTLVTLNLMTVCKKRTKSGSFIQLCGQCKCYCVLPWIVGSCIAVPVVVTSASDNDLTHFDDVLCIGNLPEPILITFSLIALHLPCYLNVAYLVTVFACHSRWCHGTQPPATEPDSETEAVHDVEDNVLLSALPVVVYVTCLLPLVAYTWAWFLYGWSAPEPFSAAVAVFLLSRSVLQPVSWLVCRDVRVEVVRVDRFLKTAVGRLNRQTEISIQTSVPYDVLHESQII